MPRPEPQFAPAWDPSGSRVAWGSSAEKAVWVWDLADPPDAIPTVLRRPDADFAKQGLFASGGAWLVVSQAGSLAFWPLVQPKVRILAGHAERVNRLLFTSDSQSLLVVRVRRRAPLAARPGTGSGAEGRRRLSAMVHERCPVPGRPANDARRI